MKTTKWNALYCLLIATLSTLPMHLRAEDEMVADKPGIEGKANDAAAAKNAKAIPFHGKIKAVDKDAKTIAVGERTIQVSSETKINKDGKPARLEDAVIGEAIGGTYVKAADGKLIAQSLRFGAKPEPASAAQAKKSKGAQ